MEVDQAGPSAMGESPDAQSATLGSSISSKTRAKRNFDSHLEGYDILQKMDILRHLCFKLQTSGKAVLGVEVTSRFQTKLTKWQVIYAVKLLLDAAEQTRSLQFWLPTLILEELRVLKKQFQR